VSPSKLSSSQDNHEIIHRRLQTDVKILIKETQSKPRDNSALKVVMNAFIRHFDAAIQSGKHHQLKISNMLRESKVFVVLVETLKEVLVTGKTDKSGNHDGNLDVGLFLPSLSILANFFVFDGPGISKVNPYSRTALIVLTGSQ